MEIAVKYENVPHFCLSCGRLGHAAQICEEGEPESSGIKFAEELRASPPKQVREISIWQAASKVVRPLFQVGMHGSRMSTAGSEKKIIHDPKEIETSMSSNGRAMQNEGTANRGREGQISAEPSEIIRGINAMHVEEKPRSPCLSEHRMEGKERVSFGMNMSTEEEVSDSGSDPNDGWHLTTSIARFHARKFGAKADSGAGKRAVLKVEYRGSEETKDPKQVWYTEC
jgi:hypothetical protein